MHWKNKFGGKGKSVKFKSQILKYEKNCIVLKSKELVNFCNYDYEENKSSHNKPGLLSIMKTGSGKGGLNFIITTKKLRNLDKDYATIGKVISGMETINFIAKYSAEEFIINDCGLYEEDKMEMEDD